MCLCYLTGNTKALSLLCIFVHLTLSFDLCLTILCCLVACAQGPLVFFRGLTPSLARAGLYGELAYSTANSCHSQPSSSWNRHAAHDALPAAAINSPTISRSPPRHYPPCRRPPAGGLRLGLYEPLKDTLGLTGQSGHSSDAVAKRVVAGSISGGFAAAVANPLELVKVRFLSQTNVSAPLRIGMLEQACCAERACTTSYSLKCGRPPSALRNPGGVLKRLCCCARPHADSLAGRARGLRHGAGSSRREQCRRRAAPQRSRRPGRCRAQGRGRGRGGGGGRDAVGADADRPKHFAN